MGLGGYLAPRTDLEHYRSERSATGLWGSVVITLLALFVFGAVKAKFTGIRLARGGIQTVLIGGLAAGAAFAIALLIS